MHCNAVQCSECLAVLYSAVISAAESSQYSIYIRIQSNGLPLILFIRSNLPLRGKQAATAAPPPTSVSGQGGRRTRDPRRLSHNPAGPACRASQSQALISVAERSGLSGKRALLRHPVVHDLWHDLGNPACSNELTTVLVINQSINELMN